MLKELIQNKNLPSFKSREEMLDILQREEYGYMPPKPDNISFSVKEKFISHFCAGKAISRKVDITVELYGKTFTFPVYVSIPSGEGKHPFFVCINFRDCVPDRFVPVEEIIDSGYGVLTFRYTDVTSDDGDFTNGLAGVIYPDGKRSKDSPGKIAMWAWAAQRVLDYAETACELDMKRAAVCGHSRLGKTAMLAAATDLRFALGYTNNSGCGGAAITRGKDGEKVEDICRVFPFWFCENYSKYVCKEDKMPFDQHYLAACIAPRYLCVGSAAEDKWADPVHEMLNCVAVGEFYESLGMTGFVCEDRLPEVGDVYHGGSIGYHLRSGCHYFSREDWQKVIKFADKRM